MIWRGEAGNEMTKGSEQKGIQSTECGRTRAVSCCSWGGATEATKSWFPFLLLQSVLPEETDGLRSLVTLATPSHCSCNKWISGAWEKTLQTVWEAEKATFVTRSPYSCSRELHRSHPCSLVLVGVSFPQLFPALELHPAPCLGSYTPLCHPWFLCLLCEHHHMDPLH